MRPISKQVPIGNTGIPLKIFNKYGDAKPYLEHQTLRYCHFCEMPILNVPAVEHIKPQKCKVNPNKYINLRNHWENLLLICFYCNRIKDNQDVKLGEYYWPHRNNTLIPFEYRTGTVRVNGTELTDEQREKADRTIRLYGLDRIKTKGRGQEIRFEGRLRAISQATERLNEYSAQPQAVTLDAIIGQATDSGFWSVWFNVFENFPNVRLALIKAFQVPIECFDHNHSPICRNRKNQQDSI